MIARLLRLLTSSAGGLAALAGTAGIGLTAWLRARRDAADAAADALSTLDDAIGYRPDAPTLRGAVARTALVTATGLFAAGLGYTLWRRYYERREVFRTVDQLYDACIRLPRAGATGSPQLPAQMCDALAFERATVYAAFALTLTSSEAAITKSVRLMAYGCAHGVRSDVHASDLMDALPMVFVAVEGRQPEAELAAALIELFHAVAVAADDRVLPFLVRDETWRLLEDLPQRHQRLSGTVYGSMIAGVRRKIDEFANRDAAAHGTGGGGARSGGGGPRDPRAVTATLWIEHHRTLGLELGSSPDEVTRAYRRLARQWHPDKNSHSVDEATAKLQSINAARDALLNETLRQQFSNVR